MVMKDGDMMQINYLLNSERAEKYYSEYVKDLPMVVIWPHDDISDKIYNNAAEAFLFNDIEKLDAMREADVSEKYLTGDASDFEKFKEFCRILPNYCGNHVYYYSHIELLNIFECDLDICEANAELIWNHINRVISEKELSENKVLQDANIHIAKVMKYDWILDLWDQDSISDWPSMERFIIEKIRKADEMGIKGALLSVPTIFVKPNPYEANIILQRYRKDMYDDEELPHLYMQIFRTIAIELKRLGWTMYAINNKTNRHLYCRLNDNTHIDRACQYLKEIDGLPKIAKLTVLPSSWTYKEYLKQYLSDYVNKYPLGNMIFTIDIDNVSNPFARYDFCRRVICNKIAEAVEVGAYTNDENTVKSLIQNVLYNNYSEFIG